MLYHLDFRVQYPPTMSQEELFTIWSEEADAAMGAQKAGVVLNIWKCVGTRRVIAIVNVESSDQLDQIIMDLPIVKKLGQYVNIEVTSLRSYEDFATDLNARKN
ncbi:muconolactone Delta-isomerase family protein [Okeania sp.]|uniref:muconolactone Delta-isomerase n=1 Tax=Okeania sp. TaxID=3100323 RepID=UPI002B4B1A07|nr:muconolactone Delta-isomerase family protein [Okeania sp.]MEB3343745.1 muconolactone Delta-isomerase family protein [Okeania sp.]